MNRELDDRVVTMFVPTDAQTAFISSSLVKQIAAYQGDVKKFVPPVVARALQNKYQHPAHELTLNPDD
jgi:pantetheine-phosphate adenylyltransferase